MWGSESDTETVLMVTHGIDEAILLADRIVVMANPPFPAIRDIIPVPLARPRHRAAVVEDPALATVQARLMTVLSEDQIIAA